MLRILIILVFFSTVICPPLWADYGQYGFPGGPRLKTQFLDNACNSRPYTFIWQHPDDSNCQYMQPNATPWFNYSGSTYPNIMPFGTTGNGSYSPYPYYNPGTSNYGRPGYNQYYGNDYNNNGNHYNNDYPYDYSPANTGCPKGRGPVLWLDPYGNPYPQGYGDQDNWLSPYRPLSTLNRSNSVYYKDTQPAGTIQLMPNNGPTAAPQFKLQHNPADNTYQYNRPDGVVKFDPKTNTYQIGAPAEQSQRPTFRIKYDPKTKTYVIQK